MTASSNPSAREQPRLHPERRAALWVARAAGFIVYAYLVVVEVVLALGFFLLLFGANPSAGFTEWVYRSLDRVMAPFRGIFTPIELGGADGQIDSVLETSVLFAMVIYGLLVLALQALNSWLTAQMHRLDREDAEYRRRLDIDAFVRAQSASPTSTGTAGGFGPSGSAPAGGDQPGAT